MPGPVIAGPPPAAWSSQHMQVPHLEHRKARRPGYCAALSRHTLVSRWIMAGVAVRTVQELMGRGRPQQPTGTAIGGCGPVKTGVPPTRQVVGNKPVTSQMA